MATIFTPCKVEMYTLDHSFAMSDDVYELLIGDNDFPMSPNGVHPVVVAVEKDRLAALLHIAGKDVLSEDVCNNQYLECPEYKGWRDLARKIAKDENWEQLHLLHADYCRIIATNAAEAHYSVG